MAKKENSDNSQIILVPKIIKYTGANPLNLVEQKELYEGVLDLKEKYNGFPGLDAHFQFDGEKGITGSNLPYLVLVNKFLANKGERTPTFYEAVQLDKKGLLTNEVYRDYGIIIFNSGNPNSKLARKLVGLAEKKGWELPILVHASALELDKKSRLYRFGKNDSLVIYGEEAREELKNFDYDYDGNFSVQRLRRDNDGYWNPYWDHLLDSNSYGRVDWKCVGGSAPKNLEELSFNRLNN
ncbi:MAG: hypothetical protein KKA64_01700 [Nanoarchaeota archaeon]|nr:hypothetical protein [Nanoarchaeota archaeon]